MQRFKNRLRHSLKLKADFIIGSLTPIYSKDLEVY